MFRLITCVTAACDTCGGEFEDDDVPGDLHWESTAKAIDWLTEHGGWRCRPGGVLICATCVAEQDCATHGHLWDPWHRCRCAGRIPDHQPTMIEGACTRETRWCQRCPDHVERRQGALIVGQVSA